MKWIVISCALMVMTVSGCDRSEGEEQADESYERAGDDEQLEVTKSADWPEDPQRIVSMAPNITEILFELGLGDRVVAVTRYCDWPKEVQELPTIGGIDPDFEAILGAEPDVVIGVRGESAPRIVEKLGNAGVAYGFVTIDALDSVRAGIVELGQWFEIEEAATELVADLDARLIDASQRVRDAISVDHARTILVFDREPIVAAGPGSFGDEILELAGFKNGLTGDMGAYPVLDVEMMIGVDPEVIIDVTIGDEEAQVLRFWDRFDAIQAVQNKRVIHIDDPVMMRPGPRIPEALERLSKAVESL